jgi:hypothetical protein
MLSVDMLNVDMLSVVAPLRLYGEYHPELLKYRSLLEAKQPNWKVDILQKLVLKYDFVICPQTGLSLIDKRTGDKKLFLVVTK